MKGKEAEVVKTEKQAKYPGFETAMQEMANMAPGLAGKLGESYGGSIVADQDPLQKAAYQKFSDFMGQGGSGQYMNNPLYSTAKGTMMDVLNGKYLKENNPLVEYTRNKLMTQDLPDAQNRMRQAQSVRGNFYSTPGMNEEFDLNKAANDTMAGVYANNYQTELNRLMSFLNPSMQLAQSEAQIPLTDINNMQQMGAYQQQQTQTEDTAAYNEWLRARQEQMMPLQMAPQGSQIYPQYDYSMTKAEASPFQKYISPALQIGALGLAPFTGGASLMAMPMIQGMDKSFATPGADAGGFANFTNAFAPYASMAMGGMSGASGGFQNSQFDRWLGGAGGTPFGGGAQGPLNAAGRF